MVNEDGNVKEEKVGTEETKKENTGESEMTDEELEEKVKKDDDEFMKKYSDCTVDDLFTYGYIMHTVEMPGDHKAVLRTLLSGEDKAIAEKLGKYSGANVYVKAENADDILQYALIVYDNIKFAKPEDAREFICNKMSIGVKTLLMYEFTNMMKA